MTDSQKVKCPGCGTMFTPKHKNQKYHKASCGNQSRNAKYQARLRESRDKLQELLEKLHKQNGGE